ncbi:MULTISPECIES: M20 family metallopeptidase [Caproicibacterium]|uniref:Peptidase M20 domain-containing protein 2 n=1 Tax=Caproicibacterium argilliputei TaxID=3030016 RepID=A0AA97D732_9FIRM|nr:M20 family metallopeptidase [Caproicibacterium argilliputei]WOC31745.1 M20 family metallopeptidase [Caproicibacterium argilliputei]
MKQRIAEAAQQMKQEITGISNYLFNHPELGDTEYQSAAFLTALLRKEGFQVQAPYCGLKTAFRAEFGGTGGSRIALLAEYDALPGYGAENKPAHACGHNWIAASALGGALLLAKACPQMQGTVVVLGTPAEETIGRKIDLLRAGAFQDIDAVLQMHLGRQTNLHVSALAIDSWQFAFFGKASHAAATPYLGINALDAANLTFAGINALRQQLRPDVRVHGILSSGGEAPNIIPSYAACKFYARAKSRTALDDVSERVKNCARGAALMTGARLEISKFENSFDSLTVNRTLCGLMEQSLKECGITDFVQEPELTGSTDIGSVSSCVPVFYGHIGVGSGVAAPHEEAFLQVVNTEEAHRKLLQTAEAFALAIARLTEEPALLLQVKQEFQQGMQTSVS